VRIALGAALLVWLIASLAATVEESRTSWLLIALISVAARLAVEEPEAMERCFSRVAHATGDLP
jgi:hypothetical protein